MSTHLDLDLLWIFFPFSCQLSHLLMIEGSAGEAAEVLLRGRKCVCAGQVQSRTERQGPRHRYD